MAVERPAFRPDIEGLRGLAILLVVGFHAGIRALAGGFVGVDIFFVLSGYFITGMLARELTERGSVDLTGFYGKRAVRLLPALLVVLLVTLAAVMWLYAPIDRPAIASGARSVAMYSGNIDFARNSVDYFSAGENPLLHTWSLAVEEQFYLIWPLLFLIVASGVGRARSFAAERVEESEDAGERDRKRLLLAIVIAGFLSFGVSVVLTKAAQPWAFFGMPTRIWEFALGGIIALTMSNQADRTTWPATLLSVIGVLAIGLAVVTYHRATPYPGVAALMPAFGAVALLVGGARAPESWPTRALSAAWLRWFGRLSYAWYLWHWPLVGIGAVLDWDIGVAGRLAWSGIALVLAYITNRWIEEPARDGRLRIEPQWTAPAALGASILAALLAHGALRRAERQASVPTQRILAAARSDRMLHNCWATTVEQPRGACAFGDKSASTTLVLLGDSHAEHWLGALDRAGKERGWKIVAMVKGGCPVPDMPELMNARLKRWYFECTRYREAMIQRIIAMRPRGVILSSWDHYMPLNGKGSDWQVTPATWQRGLRRTYSRLAEAGIPTVAIRGTPRTWFDVPQCLSRRAARLPLAQACEYDRAGSLSPVAVAAQDRAAHGLPITFIDMNDQICAARRCSVVRNGLVVFTDDNHLTASFSKSVAPVLGARVAQGLGLVSTPQEGAARQAQFVVVDILRGQ
jgi:peptidoglycan/LPS O-acetylase OafA/YrhL